MPQIFAHRAGPEGRFPDNSIEALRHALAVGVDGIEIDARPSAEGTWFVYHDRTLGHRRFSTLSSKLIERHRLRNGEAIPRLESFLAQVREGTVLLELKDPKDPRKVLDAALSSLSPDRVIFGSFQHSFLRAMRRLHPRVRCGLVIQSVPANPRRYLRLYQAEGYWAQHRIAARLASFASVYAWTVNRLETALQLAERGVEGLITNYPSRLMVLRGCFGNESC